MTAQDIIALASAVWTVVRIVGPWVAPLLPDWVPTGSIE